MDDTTNQTEEFNPVPEKLVTHKPEEVQRELLDSKTSDLKPAVEVPTVGRMVLYFPNGNDHAATMSEDVAVAFPATVVKSPAPPATHLTLSVHTDGSGNDPKGSHLQLKEEVRYKGDLAQFGGTLKGINDVGIPYWDWPVIGAPAK